VNPLLLPSLQRPEGIAALRWVIGVVLALGLVGCVVKGANSPADPYLASPGVAPDAIASGPRTVLQGFGETRLSVHNADTVLTWCLLLAATEQQRQRGLMQVTDQSLGGHDGMLFRYDADSTTKFWMRNTPMPLSIAYVDGAGQLISTADMEPCADSPECRLYPSAAPYRIAIEVPQGRLAGLGIQPGATIVDENTACT